MPRRREAGIASGSSAVPYELGVGKEAEGREAKAVWYGRVREGSPQGSIPSPQAV